MNELATTGRRLPNPTFEEPIPILDGEYGLKLLRSATAYQLAKTLNAADRQEARTASEHILASLIPAKAGEVALAMESLSLHFPVLRRTEGESRIVQLQWLDDLHGWPLDLIDECCRLWRNGGKDRFPTPGQFKTPMEKVFEHRAALAKRAADFLEATSD